MKWDLATTLGVILVVSNAIGILVLFEIILFGVPYISIFLVVFYIVYEINKSLFLKQRHTAKKTDEAQSLAA
jgi:hypothetical protein